MLHGHRSPHQHKRSQPNQIPPTPTTKRNQTKPAGAPPPSDREKPSRRSRFTGGRASPPVSYPPAGPRYINPTAPRSRTPVPSTGRRRLPASARTHARSRPEQSAPAPLAPLPEGPAAAAGDGAEEDPGVRLQAPPPGAPQAPRRHRPPDPLRAGHLSIPASSPAALLLPAARRLSDRRVIWWA